MRVLIVKIDYPRLHVEVLRAEPGTRERFVRPADGRAIPDDVRHVRLLLAGAARHGPRGAGRDPEPGAGSEGLGPGTRRQLQRGREEEFPHLVR